MKKFSKTMLGVTLLEIMLVLAVAAMIIVMSVRYYQSANSSQQANQVIQQIQAITSSADSLSQGSGSYSQVSTNKIGPLLSNVGGLNVPWSSSTITVTNASKTGYTVNVPAVPAGVCGLIWGRLQDPTRHYKTTSTCNSTGSSDLTYTYTANPPNSINPP